MTLAWQLPASSDKLSSCRFTIQLEGWLLANERVTVTVENQVGLVRLNRAEKLNAFDFPMFMY